MEESFDCICSWGKTPFHVMKSFFGRKWGKYGEMKIFLLKTGVFIVEFAQEMTRMEVIEAGPWSFDNKPLVVKPWSATANLEREDLMEIPIWVRFPNLKLHLWSPSVLSKLASVVGRPLFTDKMTAERERLMFARVCVEIKSGDVLPQMIGVQDEDGSQFEQKVEYEWIPMSCVGCGFFGHTDARCPKKPRLVKQWVPKKVVATVGELLVKGDGFIDKVVQTNEGGNSGTMLEQLGNQQDNGSPHATPSNGNRELTQYNNFDVLSVGEVEEPVGNERMVNDSVTIMGSEEVSEAVAKPPDKGKRRKKGSPTMGGKANKSKVSK